MKKMGTLAVDIAREAKAISLVTTATAILELTLLAAGLTALAATVTGFGCFATLERLHRLFVFFRGQRRLSACFAFACIGLCAFVAVCWVAYLGSPVHARHLS